jgi:TATA-box binding protein (TBP) (component of TFIID and TFIIIB)
VANMVFAGQVVTSENPKTPAKFNLNDLCRRVRGMSMNPLLFAGAIIRISCGNTKVAFRIFPNGRLVCVGPRTVSEALEAKDYMMNLLSDRMAGAKYQTQFFDTKNIVCTSNLGQTVHQGCRFNCSAFSKDHPDISEYNPTDFPGVVINMSKIMKDSESLALSEEDMAVEETPKKESKMVFLAFWRGSLNLTGAKTMEEAEEAFRIIYDMIEPYFVPENEITMPTGHGSLVRNSDIVTIMQNRNLEHRLSMEQSRVKKQTSATQMKESRVEAVARISEKLNSSYCTNELPVCENCGMFCKFRFRTSTEKICCICLNVASADACALCVV